MAAAATQRARSLREHFVGTYKAVRIALAVVAVALPIALLGYSLVAGSDLLGSMSAYYYSGARDVFVGGLFAVAGLLIAYRGFSPREDVVLNAAGIALLLVAVFPTVDPAARAMQVEAPGPLGFLSIHGASAGFFFLCIAYVCWFRARDTLNLVSSRARITRSVYRKLYVGIGIALAVSPLLAVAIAYLTRARSVAPSYIFWIEAIGVWTFALYWGVKTVELARSDADALAAAGQLNDPPKQGGPLVVLAPELDAALDTEGLTAEQSAQIRTYLTGPEEAAS